MYITFYQDIKQEFVQISFEELMSNPFMDVPENFDLSGIKTEKRSYNIPTHTAMTYFSKHMDINKVIQFLDVAKPCTLEEIPNMYTHFQIPKRTNPRKKRDIYTPKGTPLEMFQRHHKLFIDNYLHVLAHNAAHGYVEGRSTITERTIHQKKGNKWFLYLDLKDFFPSHNKDYCMKMLSNVYPFGCIMSTIEGYKKIEEMMDYALLNDTLPQGTPLSPTLTNMLMMPIDTDITNALQTFDNKNFTYTRYADDLTISCKQKFSPRKVIEVIEEILNKWNTPFKLNKEKIKFGSIAGRNYHLGIIINKDNQLKLGHKKNQKLRAAIFQYGMKHIANTNNPDIHQIQKLLGDISYAKMIDKDYINHVLQKYSEKFGTDVERHMIRTMNRSTNF